MSFSPEDCRLVAGSAFLISPAGPEATRLGATTRATGERADASCTLCEEHISVLEKPSQKQNSSHLRRMLAPAPVPAAGAGGSAFFPGGAGGSFLTSPVDGFTSVGASKTESFSFLLSPSTQRASYLGWRSCASQGGGTGGGSSRRWRWGLRWRRRRRLLGRGEQAGALFERRRRPFGRHRRWASNRPAPRQFQRQHTCKERKWQ